MSPSSCTQSWDPRSLYSALADVQCGDRYAVISLALPMTYRCVNEILTTSYCRPRALIKKP